MPPTPRPLFWLLMLLPVAAPRAAGPEYDLDIASGKVDRQESLVSLRCPPGIWMPELLDDTVRLPVQKGPDDHLHFVLDRLERGERKTLRLRNGSGKEPRQRRIRVEEEGGSLRFLRDGAPVLRYQAVPDGLPREDIDASFLRGGYIHPLWSPGGRQLTDDYPRDHLHHHGVWIAWPRTTFQGREPNFWEMGRRMGTVEFAGIDHYWSGEVTGGFRSRHRLVDLSGEEPIVALHETWEIRIHALDPPGGPCHIFDILSVQECATEDPVGFPEYRYGGIGFRGHGQWNGRENTRFLTGLGETDRIRGHATRAPWCHIGGEVDGRLCGVAILCHPDNFRAPQPMRIHPDEPFFCYAPSQAGDWEIRPGVPYRSRYRFILSDGSPDRAFLDRMWQDYAHPVTVRIRRVR